MTIRNFAKWEDDGEEVEDIALAFDYASLEDLQRLVYQVSIGDSPQASHAKYLLDEMAEAESYYVDRDAEDDEEEDD